MGCFERNILHDEHFYFCLTHEVFLSLWKTQGERVHAVLTLTTGWSSNVSVHIGQHLVMRIRCVLCNVLV